jgi:hypothetical protein
MKQLVAIFVGPRRKMLPMTPSFPTTPTSADSPSSIVVTIDAIPEVMEYA